MPEPSYRGLAERGGEKDKKGRGFHHLRLRILSRPYRRIMRMKAPSSRDRLEDALDRIPTRAGRGRALA